MVDIDTGRDIGAGKDIDTDMDSMDVAVAVVAVVAVGEEMRLKTLDLLD